MRNPKGAVVRIDESSVGRKDFGFQFRGSGCNLSGRRLLLMVSNMDRAGFVQSRFRFEANGGYQPPQPPKRGQRNMTKNQINALLLTAALSGLVGGTSVAAKAATNGSTRVNGVHAGMMLAGQAQTPPAKHSCKGKNGCKGTGGCSTGDQGCKGKNTCKGKGGCATDGSKPPSAV
jgi:hypothetical protein